MSCSGFVFVKTGSSQNCTLRRRLKPAAFGFFALFALIALVGARAAYPQDPVAPASDSDADWESADPDLSAASAEKVLEIPQAACVENGVSIPCDDRVSVSNSPDNDDEAANPEVSGAGNPSASGAGVSPASPQTLDEDTASAGPIGSDSDWGTADDYANQPIYGIPYGTAQYGSVASMGPIYGNPQIPPSMAFPFPPMAMSSPLTQAARPPLYSAGPWMTSPSMMMFSRPAGTPMAGQPFRFH